MIFLGACGIICEYDPFHTGHAYQISEVKRLLGSEVVCAMSGSFTQRACPSCMDKEKRASNAVKNGADVVLEIPFPFSSLSANGFAKAGVTILANSAMCSHIAFGSESADLALLSETAKILSDGGFEKKLRAFQKSNPSLSYARARCILISDLYGEKYARLLEAPNDILAVEYLRANLELGSPLIPVAIKRTTQRTGRNDRFASSSYIRNAVLQNKSGKIISEMPCENVSDNVNEISQFLPYEVSLEDFYTDNSLFEKIMQVCIMTKNPKELEGLAEIPRGSGYALVKNAYECETFSEFLKMLSTKSYTNAKIRRMVLFGFAGVGANFLKDAPLYTQLLAYSDKGRALLAKTRKNRKIIVASKISNIKHSQGAFCQYTQARRMEEILKKCRSK